MNFEVFQTFLCEAVSFKNVGVLTVQLEKFTSGELAYSAMEEFFADVLSVSTVRTFGVYITPMHRDAEDVLIKHLRIFFQQPRKMNIIEFDVGGDDVRCGIPTCEFLDEKSPVEVVTVQRADPLYLPDLIVTTNVLMIQVLGYDYASTVLPFRNADIKRKQTLTLVLDKINMRNASVHILLSHLPRFKDARLVIKRPGKEGHDHMLGEHLARAPFTHVEISYGSQMVRELLAHISCVPQIKDLKLSHMRLKGRCALETYALLKGCEHVDTLNLKEIKWEIQSTFFMYNALQSHLKTIGLQDVEHSQNIRVHFDGIDYVELSGGVSKEKFPQMFHASSLNSSLKGFALHAVNICTEDVHYIAGVYELPLQMAGFTHNTCSLVDMKAIIPRMANNKYQWLTINDKQYDARLFIGSILSVIRTNPKLRCIRLSLKNVDCMTATLIFNTIARLNKILFVRVDIVKDEHYSMVFGAIQVAFSDSPLAVVKLNIDEERVTLVNRHPLSHKEDVVSFANGIHANDRDAFLDLQRIIKKHKQQSSMPSSSSSTHGNKRVRAF